MQVSVNMWSRADVVLLLVVVMMTVCAAEESAQVGVTLKGEDSSFDPILDGNEKPAEKKSELEVQAQPMGDKPVGDKPMGEPMGEKQMGDTQPMGDKPVGNKPMGEPKEDKLVGDTQPMGDKPMGDKPVSDKPMGEPMGDKPVSEKPMGDKSVDTQQMGDKTASDMQPAGDKPVGNQPMNNTQPTGDRPIAHETAMSQTEMELAKVKSSEIATQTTAEKKPVEDTPVLHTEAGNNTLKEGQAKSTEMSKQQEASNNMTTAGKPEPSSSQSEGMIIPKDLLWRLTPEIAQRGLRISVSRNGTNLMGTLDKPYNGDDDKLLGMWWVTYDRTAEYDLFMISDMSVIAAAGLPVTVLETREHGVVLSVDIQSGHPSIISVKLSSTGNTKQFQHKDLEPKQIEFLFGIGDRVRVRDKPDVPWKTGIVNNTDPVLVKVDGWKKAYRWLEVELLIDVKSAAGGSPDGAKQETAEVMFDINDRVEVRDSEGGEWKLGTVVSIEDDGRLSVRVDGWKAAYKWKYTRKTELPPEMQAVAKSTPPPGGSSFSAVWKAVCSNANCQHARKEGLTCNMEYICGNTSGCTFDPLESPPCKNKFKIGDSVALSPSGPDQGALHHGEVGVIIGIMDDEQPYEVRGGYSDSYRYREEEIVPAWDKEVSWANEAHLNPVLVKWRGHASFGEAGELLEGAQVNPGYKSPPPEWDDEPPTPPPAASRGISPVAIKPLTAAPIAAVAPMSQTASTPASPATAPPASPVAPVTPPAATPVTSATPAPAIKKIEKRKTTPPATPPADKNPPPAETPPAVKTPTPASKITKRTIQPPKKIVKVAAPKELVVYAPESPTICGIYKELSSAVRGYPVWQSDTCQTGECVLFISHGGYWMIGKEGDDAKNNRGVFKSVEKANKLVKGQKQWPNVLSGGWQYLDNSWQESDGFVLLPDQQEQKMVDWMKCGGSGGGGSGGMMMETDMEMETMKESAPLPPSSPSRSRTSKKSSEPEKRMDEDGMLYTKEEFRSFYGDDTRWEQRAGGSAPTVGANVVSKSDISIAGSVVVKEGTSGVVSSIVGAKITVKFTSETGKPITIPLSAAEITVV